MNTETVESKAINDYLGTLEKVPLRDDPLFRLVWSDEQFELRTFIKQLYMGNRCVGEVESTENTPKYPWIEGRWVFEMWFGPDVVLHDELPESDKGSYEPLYVFEGKDKQPLPLNLTVIEFIISRIRKPKSSPSLIKSIIQDDKEARALRQRKLDEDYLDVSPMASNLHFGEGILVPSNYPVESPNLRRAFKADEDEFECQSGYNGPQQAAPKGFLPPNSFSRVYGKD
jgi:hypothetical protein